MMTRSAVSMGMAYASTMTMEQQRKFAIWLKEQQGKKELIDSKMVVRKAKQILKIKKK